MEKLDLRGIPCPQNTSKAIIFLSGIDFGEEVEILLDNGEPISNVPSSLELEGYKILSKEQVDSAHWKLVLVV